MMAAGAGAERDGLRPVFVPNGEHTLGNLVERIVPGDALPFAGLAFAFAPQRIFEPIRVIYKIGRHRPDRTQAAMIERRLAIALDLHQYTVLDMQQDAAAAMATAADALEHRGGQMVGYQTRLVNVHICNLLPGLGQAGAEHVSPECKIGPFHATLA